MKHGGGNGSTGISVFNNDYTIEFADTSRATFDDYFVGIGSWNGGTGISVTVPAGTQKNNDCWQLGGDNIVSFVNVGTVIYNVTSPF